MIVELTRFRVPGDVDAFLAADALAQAELSSVRGFIRRTTARSDDDWLVTTFWYDADHAQPHPEHFLGHVTDVTVERYETLD